jgi:archaellin
MDEKITTEATFGQSSTKVTIRNDQGSHREFDIVGEDGHQELQFTITYKPGAGTIDINDVPISDMQRRLLVEFLTQIE